MQEQKPIADKRKKGDFARYLGMASTVGINMVTSTFVGFAIGHWILDKYLNTSPRFTILFTILGIASGFRYLLRMAMKQEKNGNSEGST